MWPSSNRTQTFFRSPADEGLPSVPEARYSEPTPSTIPSPPSETPPVPVPGKGRALFSYAVLVFSSAFLALFMAEATDPVRGFLPIVLDPPPAHSAPRGFEASFGVSRLYARSTIETPRPLVSNSGDTFRFPPVEGLASWYGYDHIGRKTADGGWFDPEAMTAAHRTLPFGAIVRVTRLSTGKSVEVTINDRGPYIEGRVVDLSRRAATELGIQSHGIARCRVEVLRYPLGERRLASVSDSGSTPAPALGRDPDPAATRSRPTTPARIPLKKADPQLKSLLLAQPPLEDQALELPLPPPAPAP